MKEVKFSDMVNAIGDIGYYIGTLEGYKGKLLAVNAGHELMGIKRKREDDVFHEIDNQAIVSMYNAITKLGINIKISLFNDEYEIQFHGFVLKDDAIVNEEKGNKIVGFTVNEHHILEVKE